MGGRNWEVKGEGRGLEQGRVTRDGEDGSGFGSMELWEIVTAVSCCPCTVEIFPQLDPGLLGSLYTNLVFLSSVKRWGDGLTVALLTPSLVPDPVAHVASFCRTLQL